VPPATWKKAMRLKGGKDESREAAMRLWPASAGLFARVKDNDRAEAALIAEWGRNNLLGEENARLTRTVKIDNRPDAGSSAEGVFA
jgi:hypothetical protein